MYEILGKTELTLVTKLFEIRAPLVAHKAQSGQFVIIRIHEQGERIPLPSCPSSASAIEV